MGYNKKRQNDKSTRYEAYTDFLSSKDKLEIKMWRSDGKVVKFSVTYLIKHSQEWLVIKRYDNAHPKKQKGQILKIPHCHIYGYKNKRLYIFFLKGEPSTLLTRAIKDIKKRREELLKNYFNHT